MRSKESKERPNSNRFPENSLPETVKYTCFTPEISRAIHQINEYASVLGVLLDKQDPENPLTYHKNGGEKLND